MNKKEAQQVIKILTEALPYIQKFSKKFVSLSTVGLR